MLFYIIIFHIQHWFYTFGTSKNECMDNQLLVSLSEKYGSPLYVYDAEKISTQYNRIINAFSTVKSLKLNYASPQLMYNSYADLTWRLRHRNG